MRTINIKYQNKSFWIEDLFIEMVSHFICQSFESIGINTFNTHLKNIYDDCDMNRKFPTPDLINIMLDEDILNSTDKQTLINVLEQAKQIVLNYGVEISVNQLNAIEATKAEAFFRHFWDIPIKTASLVTTLTLIQQLLDGTFPYTVQSYQYEGFGGVRTGEIVI